MKKEVRSSLVLSILIVLVGVGFVWSFSGFREGLTGHAIVFGPELVNCGDFNCSTGWDMMGTWTISDGTAKGRSGVLRKFVDIQEQRSYEVSFRVVSFQQGGMGYLQIILAENEGTRIFSAEPGEIIKQEFIIDELEYGSPVYFVPKELAVGIFYSGRTRPLDVEIDDVSVQEVLTTPDIECYNNSGCGETVINVNCFNNSLCTNITTPICVNNGTPYAYCTEIQGGDCVFCSNGCQNNSCLNISESRCGDGICNIEEDNLNCYEDCEANETLLLNLNVSQFKNIEINENEYRIEIISINGVVELSVGVFETGETFFINLSGGEVGEVDGLRIEVKEINNGEVSLEIQEFVLGVEEVAYCGDGNCSNGENYINCFEDCKPPASVEYCGNGKCAGGQEVTLKEGETFEIFYNNRNHNISIKQPTVYDISFIVNGRAVSGIALNRSREIDGLLIYVKDIWHNRINYEFESVDLVLGETEESCVDCYEIIELREEPVVIGFPEVVVEEPIQTRCGDGICEGYERTLGTRDFVNIDIKDRRYIVRATVESLDSIKLNVEEGDEAVVYVSLHDEVVVKGLQVYVKHIIYNPQDVSGSYVDLLLGEHPGSCISDCKGSEPSQLIWEMINFPKNAMKGLIDFISS